MNELSVFEHSEFGSLDIIEIDGKPFFPATKCAKILGHENPQRAVRKFCKEVTEMVTPSKGGNQEINFIPEGDLYRLIIHSRLPAAERFEKWVFDEVIPSIRKHGAYLTPAVAEQVLSDPDLIIRMAQQIKDEREQRKRLESQIDEDKPFTDMGRFVYGCDRNVRIGDFAKLLPNAGIQIGPRKLREWMKKNGYIAQDNSPAQRYVDAGIFRARVVKGERAEQDPIYFSPTITPKGQQFFIEKLKADEAIRWTEAEEK